MKKEEGRRRVQEIVQKYQKLEKWENVLQERDITSKFVMPLLLALNWDIYRVTKYGLEVSEQGFPGQTGKKIIGKGQPDIRLKSKTGKVVHVEVKRKLPQKISEKILEEYARYRERNNGESMFIVLTSFRKTIIFTRGKKGIRRRSTFTIDDYVEKFDELWQLLSNSPKATHKRASLKATG